MTNIAIRYLLPAQITNNGVKDGEAGSDRKPRFGDIVRYYTCEAGMYVRLSASAVQELRCSGQGACNLASFSPRWR